jgi:hypothetical protein
MMALVIMTNADLLCEGLACLLGHPMSLCLLAEGVALPPV